MQVHKTCDYVNQHMPRPVFFIPDVLAKQGTLMIFGAPGTRKSWLVQNLGFCIAAGDQWLGWDTRQGNVGLVNFELPELGFYWRLKLMAEKFGGDYPLYDLTAGDMALEREDQMMALIGTLRPYELDVVILDCLRHFFRGDENKAQDAGQMGTMFKMLRDELDCSIIVVHHENKNQEATGSARMSGNTAWDGYFDTVIHLVRQPGGSQLRFTKNRWAFTLDTNGLLRPVNAEFIDYTWRLRGANSNISGGEERRNTTE